MLSLSKMLLRVEFLTIDSVNDTSNDIFSGSRSLQILDKIHSFLGLTTLQIVNNKIESGFRENIKKRRKNLESIFTASENNQIMSEDIKIFKDISILILLLQDLEFHLGLFTIENLILVASLKVSSNDTGRVLFKVSLQDIVGDIIVVHLVIAEGNVGIDGKVFSILQQKLFVDISSFFIVASKIMDSSQSELIMGSILDLVMVGDQGILIALLVGNMEHQSNVKVGFRTFSTLSLGFIVVAEGVQATGLVDVELLVVVSLLHEIIIDIDSFLVVSIMEIAIGKPEEGITL
mmetsp:Transcript_35933/g.32331  ORF Transcript_35933/g.32331 Transcript_35933/m.32331 type:complete len:291 (+) Transcript_35933:700-1572(+)